MRKLLILFIMLISTVLTLSACLTHKNAVNTDILFCLGKTDFEVTEFKGNGNAQTYERDGNTFVISRSFKDEIFGLSCQTEYMYSDNQIVSQIITEFKEPDRNVILSAVTSTLGEPEKLQQQTNDTQFKAVWQMDAFSYTLIQQPASPIYMIIEKQ